jgi:hypothetical protein
MKQNLCELNLIHLSVARRFLPVSNVVFQVSAISQMSCSPRVGFQTPIRRSRERERGEMSEQDIPSPAEKLNQQKHFKKEKKII